MEPIVGIDLGTTNSLVAYCQAGEVSILADSKGRRLLPSIVTWQDDVSLVGHEAREQFASYPESTLYSVKRLFGKNFSELLASGHNRFAFKLSGDEKEVRIQAGSKEVYPFEVSAKVLHRLREIAEDALGQSVTRAVITVPAWFDDSQRQETRHAASLAGLEVVRMINEPTAAALAYGIDTKGKGKVVVYDLGGGTFDVSVLNLEDGVFQVLATHGDTFLGGDDMDHAIADWLLKQLPESSGVTDAVQIALKFAAEQLKIQLSEASEATINLDLPSGFRLQATLTRAEFEKLIEPLVQKTLKSARIALRDSGLEISDITDVVLVGGATRVPCIREAVRQFFARSPFTGINPDEVVAMGAATQASVLMGERRDLLLLDVLPLSLGIETLGGAVSKILLRNTTIPCLASEEFTTSVDQQTSVSVHVLQGERELVEDCRSLARFKIRIPPMPAGLPRLKVTFTVDENGILAVNAEELRSGKTAGVEVFPSIGISQEKVDRLIEESIENALEDFDIRMLVELRNKGQRILFATDRVWDKAVDYYSREDLELLQSLMSELRQALSRGEKDQARLQLLVDQLGDMTRPLADHVFSSATREALAGKSMGEV